MLTRGNNVMMWNAEHEEHLRCICKAVGTVHPKRSTYQAVRAVIAHHLGEYKLQKDACEAHAASDGSFRKFRQLLDPHMVASGIGVVKELRDIVEDDVPQGEIHTATSAATI